MGVRRGTPLGELEEPINDRKDTLLKEHSCRRNNLRDLETTLVARGLQCVCASDRAEKCQPGGGLGVFVPSAF